MTKSIKKKKKKVLKLGKEAQKFIAEKLNKYYGRRAE